MGQKNRQRTINYFKERADRQIFQEVKRILQKLDVKKQKRIEQNDKKNNNKQN